MKMAMAQNHLRLGNKKAAANLYREILSDEPDNTDAAFALSRIYIAIKRPGLAAPLLENVIRLDPGHIQAHIDLCLGKTC